MNINFIKLLCICLEHLLLNYALWKNQTKPTFLLHLLLATFTIKQFWNTVPHLFFCMYNIYIVRKEKVECKSCLFKHENKHQNHLTEELHFV